MLDGWFCRTVANQKSMDQIDQDEAQSDSQEGEDLDYVIACKLVKTNKHKSIIIECCWQRK